MVLHWQIDILHWQDSEELKQLTRSIIKKKEEASHDNVAQMALKQGRQSDSLEEEEDEDDDDNLTLEEKEEKKVVKQLEKKYGTMRDKLIIEVGE